MSRSNLRTSEHITISSDQSRKRNPAWNDEFITSIDNLFYLLIFRTPCGQIFCEEKSPRSDFDDGIPLDELPEYRPRPF